MSYTKIFSLDPELYADGAPVVIEAGALQRNIQKNQTVMQLRFRSLSPESIQAVMISVKAFDVLGRELQGLEEGQYLDLTTERNTAFGDTVPVVLPDPTTRTVQVKCTHVVFANGTYWTGSGEWTHLSASRDLFDALPIDSAFQYRRETVQCAQVVPLRTRGLWRCTCGTLNRQEEDACCSCKLPQQLCFDAYNPEILEAHAQEYARQEEEKRRLAEEKRRKTIIWATAVSLMAVLLTFTILALTVFYPRQRDQQVFEGYNQMAHENFQTAVTGVMEAKHSPEEIQALLDSLQVTDLQTTVEDGVYQLTAVYHVNYNGFPFQVQIIVEGDRNTAAIRYEAS